MSKFLTIQDATAKTIKYIKGRMDGTITSMRTGYPKLDKALLDGIEWQSTVTIGGRPSVGKSTVSDCLVDGALENNPSGDFEVLDFNWEMASQVILLRRAASKFKKSYKHIISADNNKITEEEFEALVQILADHYGTLPITFCEEPLTTKEFEHTVGKFCEERPGKKILVRVDHTLLTRQAADEDSQQKMLQNLLAKANILKKKFPLIFMFLTQLNRDFEDRQDNMTDKAFPRQSDVYGGDATAFFSETMILLNKPSKYGIKMYGNRYPGQTAIMDDDLYMHVVKNRNADAENILRYKANFKHMTINED